MSAFVVSEEHVDALVRGALAPRYGSHDLTWYWHGELYKCDSCTADEIGTMLQEENVRSVEYRYPNVAEDELPGTYREEAPAPGVAAISFPDWLTPYTYRPGKAPLPPINVLRLLDCFEYQSCEHDDWRDSCAYAFCDALRRKMIAMLPGYDEALWAL
jgi:hypothetical protein